MSTDRRHVNAGFTELSVDTLREDGRTVVRVAGDLDHDSAPGLRAELEGFDEAVRFIELDLAGVTFIDSGALQVFVSVHSELQSRGGSLRIVNASPVVARILAMTRLDEVFGT